MELLKVRLQLQTAVRGEAGYVGPLRLLGSILRREGLPGGPAEWAAAPAWLQPPALLLLLLAAPPLLLHMQAFCCCVLTKPLQPPSCCLRVP